MSTANLPPMTDAEVHTIRTRIGLSAKDLARMIGLGERTIRDWETGAWPIKSGHAQHIRELNAATRTWINEQVQALEEVPWGERVLRVYRTDAQFVAAIQAGDVKELLPWPRPPVSWHTLACSHVADWVDGARLVYAPDPGRPAHLRPRHG